MFFLSNIIGQLRVGNVNFELLDVDDIRESLIDEISHNLVVRLPLRRPYNDKTSKGIGGALMGSVTVIFVSFYGQMHG